MAFIHSRYRKAINLLHLSGSALKVIAIISMVIDHCAYYLMEHDTLLYEVMRCFGRIAVSGVCVLDSGRVSTYAKSDEIFFTTLVLCCNQ